jgi:membrane-associated protein
LRFWKGDILEFIRNAFHLLTDVQGIVEWGGVLMVCFIVFVETGLFVGFFLPGDSLLVTAGIFASVVHLNLPLLLVSVSLCAIAGDQLNYWIGRKTGEALYRRGDSFFFRRKHLQRAHDFYEKYGGKTVVLARFVPIVRTFAPAVAGAAHMKYRRYLAYDVMGGVLWVWSMILAGYFLSSAIPDITKHIHLVIVVVILLSVLPVVIEIVRNRRRETAAGRVK